MNDLCRALRAAATAALPPGAFLRRDRGNALFITDAPRIDPRADLTAALAEAGFACAGADGLLRLWPAESWLAQVEAATPDPPDDLCRSLIRFRGQFPDGASLGLFALGLRCLDGGEGAARFDRLLRQRAAQCLRERRATLPPPAADIPAGAPMRSEASPSWRRPPEATPIAGGASPPLRASDRSPLSPGGGLYACALLDHELEVQSR